ncbi:hypothetical protein BN2476_470079 [Paraburkholderia piptadeniae]|uniref:Uncharacterized protein n=1 Tax=Paraburkholderia piptadeniae TaxID=1701573 RepID=A0A1N7SE56_9BURK|nr:hypothetical protein BN2476_470079 [Paraburkholderia piptadeniae]
MRERHANRCRRTTGPVLRNSCGIDFSGATQMLCVAAELKVLRIHVHTDLLAPTRRIDVQHGSHCIMYFDTTTR